MVKHLCNRSQCFKLKVRFNIFHFHPCNNLENYVLQSSFTSDDERMQNANIFGQCRLFAHFGVWPWFMKKFSWYYTSERGWWTQDSRIESCSSWDELVSAVVVVSMICSGHQPRHDNLCWRRLHSSSSHSFFVSNCSTNNTRVTQIFLNVQFLSSHSLLYSFILMFV